jgi:hypothetical protein
MLVPSPSVTFKPLIGDINADEMSDLSDSSDIDIDFEIAQKTYKSTLNILPRPIISSYISREDISIIDVNNGASSNGEPAIKLNGQAAQAFVKSKSPEFVDSNNDDDDDDDEKLFDSIISPSNVQKHKKSIDEQFEQILMDDNNNNIINCDLEHFPENERCKEKEAIAR